MPIFPLKYFYVLIFLLISPFSFAQTPLLERPITLKVNSEKVFVVLETIAKQGNFSFSYNSAILDGNTRINLWVMNKPVREVLNQIFKETISFKVRKQYVILQKVEAQIVRRNLILSGYVYDTKTDNPLGKVSIYDRKSLISAVTNQYGFYRIKLSINQLPIKLIISKPDYYQEEILIKTDKSVYENIGLNRLQKAYKFVPTVEDDSMEQMDSIRNINPIPRKEITINEPQFPDITDEILFPGVPIIDSTLYLNQFDKFKKTIGKIFVPRSQRINAQNIRDSLSRGFQFSILPFLGTNRLLSGSINNKYSVNLLMGYSGGIRKFEIGGLINGVRRDMEGVQLAGLGNIVGGKVSGFQGGILFNVARQLKGGLQFSQYVNVVLKESSGWQIGTFNFAHKVVRGGKQIGSINVADSTETTPIGFLSFVRGNGYKRLELAVDENQTGSFSFKTGVPKFYNILALHYNFTRTQEIIGIGYGIGRAYKLKRNWMLNTDITANALVEYGELNANLAFLYKLDISFEKQIARNAAITFGPSLKYLKISDYNIASWQAKPFSRIPSYQSILSTETSTFWIGFQMGFRIRSR